MNIEQASVINIYKQNSPQDLKNIADFFFLGSQIELEKSPKIGVVLEPTIALGSPALKIIEISPHGKAAEAGLLVGDILLEIDAEKISEMADVKIAMLDKNPGESIDLTILRPEKNGDKQLAFTVELTVPPALPRHP